MEDGGWDVLPVVAPRFGKHWPQAGRRVSIYIAPSDWPTGASGCGTHSGIGTQKTAKSSFSPMLFTHAHLEVASTGGLW